MNKRLTTNKNAQGVGNLHFKLYRSKDIFRKRKNTEIKCVFRGIFFSTSFFLKKKKILQRNKR